MMDIGWVSILNVEKMIIFAVYTIKLIKFFYNKKVVQEKMTVYTRLYRKRLSKGIDSNHFSL